MNIPLNLEITLQTTYPMDIFVKTHIYESQRFSFGYSLCEEHKPTVHHIENGYIIYGISIQNSM